MADDGIEKGKNMLYSNTLNLIQVGGGTQVKQGDLGSKFSYKLANENDQELDDFDKEVAHINLVLDDKIVFTTTATVDNSTVTFNIDKAIPIGLYFLEIKIRDYIFPSDKQTIIFVQSGAVAYDLKELVPNYDVNMTLKGILSDLSQKGIDISDLNRQIGNANAELIAARNGKSNLKTRIDDLENETTAQLAEKANKDEVTNVMTPRGNIAYASLPKTGNSVGWYYYCPDGDGTHGAGNYVWNGTSWYFGGTGDEGYNLLKKDLGDTQSKLSKSIVKIDDRFLHSIGVNKFNPEDEEQNITIQASGLKAPTDGYNATGFIYVPFGSAIVVTGTKDGTRGITTNDGTGMVGKMLCVYASDKASVVVDEGKNSQYSTWMNVNTDGGKYVRVSYRKEKTTDLEINVVEAMKKPSGEWSEYLTYTSASGYTKYSPFDEHIVLKGEHLPYWYYGKKIATFGDSITYLNKWQPYISEYFGCSIQNCGIGGSTVCLTNNEEHQNDCMYQDTRINAINTDSDVILVFGGHNDSTSSGVTIKDFVPWWNLTDSGDVHDFTYAYSLMLKKLINRFPNAKIITMTCVNGRTSNADENQDSQFYIYDRCMDDFSEVIKKISHYYGIPCIDVGGESGISVLNHTSYIMDVIHPNDEGGKMIANAVINGLKRYEPIDL